MGPGLPEAVFIWDIRVETSQTGNRRFWPIRTGEIDLEGIAELRDQFWAEAAHYEAQGESIELPRELWGAAELEQQKRLESDGWEPILAEVQGEPRGDREVVLSRQLLTKHLQIPPEKAQSYHWKRLGRAMRALGWEGPTTVNVPGEKTGKGFWRPAREDDDDCPI